MGLTYAVEIKGLSQAKARPFATNEWFNLDLLPPPKQFGFDLKAASSASLSNFFKAKLVGFEYSPRLIS